MMSRVIAFLLGSCLPFAAAIANASLMDHLLATNTPDGTISLDLPSMPDPSSFTATSFTLDGVTIDDDGTIITTDVTFFNALGGGGGSGEGYAIGGDVLFSGLTSAPTLNLGTFNVGGFPVVITGPEPIPEPASLVLLFTGMVGGMETLRRSRKS